LEKTPVVRVLPCTQTGLLAILKPVLKWIVIIGKNFVNIGKKSIIAKTAEKT